MSGLIFFFTQCFFKKMQFFFFFFTPGPCSYPSLSTGTFFFFSTAIDKSENLCLPTGDSV